MIVTNSKGNKRSSKSFYSSMPKEYTDFASRVQKYMEDQGQDFDIHFVMNEYFGEHWIEFKEFWNSIFPGDRIDWVTFACVPHNGYWLIVYCIWKYEALFHRMKSDFEKVAGSG